MNANLRGRIYDRSRPYLRHAACLQKEEESIYSPSVGFLATVLERPKADGRLKVSSIPTPILVPRSSSKLRRTPRSVSVPLQVRQNGRRIMPFLPRKPSPSFNEDGGENWENRLSGLLAARNKPLGEVNFGLLHHANYIGNRVGILLLTNVNGHRVVALAP